MAADVRRVPELVPLALIGVRPAFWAVVALMASGCASASLEVTRHGRVAQPLARLYVVVHQGTMSNEHAQELAAALLEALSAYTPAQKATVLSDLELDDRGLRADMAAFKPDGILTLTPTGGAVHNTTLGTTRVSQLDYTVTLFDSANEKRIWEAEAGLGGAGVSEQSTLLARRIVNALLADRLVRGPGQ